MKRLLQVVAVLAVALFAPAVVSVPVSAVAAEECVISNTGPGSENECEVEDEYECTITNDNKVTIVNLTDQTSVSGDAEVGENGTGGAAISGSASNSNNATFNIVIDNGEGESERVCRVVSVVPVAPEKPKPETPETPTPPTKEEAPKVLPVTSGDMPLALAAVGGVVTAVGVSFVYRRLFL